MGTRQLCTEQGGAPKGFRNTIYLDHNPLFLYSPAVRCRITTSVGGYIWLSPSPLLLTEPCGYFRWSKSCRWPSAVQLFLPNLSSESLFSGF